MARTLQTLRRSLKICRMEMELAIPSNRAGLKRKHKVRRVYSTDSSSDTESSTDSALTVPSSQKSPDSSSSRTVSSIPVHLPQSDANVRFEINGDSTPSMSDELSSSDSDSETCSADSDEEREKRLNDLQEPIQCYEKRLASLEQFQMQEKRLNDLQERIQCCEKRLASLEQFVLEIKYARITDDSPTSDANVNFEKTEDSTRSTSNELSFDSSDETCSEDNDEEREKALKALQEQLEKVTEDIRFLIIAKGGKTRLKKHVD